MKSLVLSVVLTASPSADAVEAEIAETLGALENHWRAGHFHDVANAASTALGLMEQSACPLRNDAALAAFMGGVAGTTHDHMDMPTGYMFWVAAEVHQQLNALPDGAVRVAETLQSRPGQSVLTDRFFLQTPYLAEGLMRGCAQDLLSEDLLTHSPPEADHVFIAFGFPRRAMTRAAPPDSIVYAYPHDEGLGLGQHIIEDGRWYDTGDRIQVRLFSPCSSYPTRDLLLVEVCRDQPIAHPELERTESLGEGSGQG